MKIFIFYIRFTGAFFVGLVISMDSIYNGGITREQFLFYEMRSTCQLIVQGYSKEEALKKILDENLYQFPTEKTIKTIAQGCFRRIDALQNDFLIREMAEGASDVAKQINLYAMMKYNKIVWDFMVTVIGEKYRTFDLSFSKKDINVFLQRLREQVEGISSWSDATMQKIGQVLMKCLVECGYVENVKSTELLNVNLVPELEEGIRQNGDEVIFPAFNFFG